MNEAETSFEHVLARCIRHEKRLQRELEHVHVLAQDRNMPGAYSAALTAANSSEKLTLLCRELPAYTGSPAAKSDMEAILSETIPVDIGFTIEGWFSIRIPALLPKKSEGSASYVRAFLYPALKAFFDGKQPVRYSDCVLVFRHVYDAARPERQYRDHDNIEINMVTDIVALYVLPDDAPLRCAHYYCSAVGKGDRTEVYVVPRHDFPQWLVTEKTMPDKGVMLHEKAVFGVQKDM